MRRLRLEDSPQDREPLRLIPLLTRGQPRRRLPARQTQNIEPPTWGQMKKLMEMTTMVTGNLGMAGNPAMPHCWWHWSLLQYRWVLSRAMHTGLSCPACQWCILSLGRDTLYLSLPMIRCTWQVIPPDVWCLNIATITLRVKLVYVHENEAMIPWTYSN
jgi:hypothetical protein